MKSPILRVDIFCYKGKLVVNEVEGLEAGVSAGGGSFQSMATDSVVFNFLTQYWLDTLIVALNKCRNGDGVVIPLFRITLGKNKKKK
jgi:hypothetical protein